MKFFLPMLCAVLVGLQIAGVINWPWYAILAPVLLPLLLFTAIATLCFLIALASALLGK